MQNWTAWRFKILMGAVLFGVLAYTAFWFIAARIAHSTLDDLITAQRKAGAKIDYSGLSTGGFPFQVELELKDFSLANGGSLPSLHITSPRIQILAMPWNPDHIILFADSPHVEKTFGKSLGPDGTEIPKVLIGQAKLLQASQIKQDGNWQATDIVFQDAVLGDLQRGDWVSIVDLEFHALRLAPPPANLTAAPLAEYSVTAEKLKPNELLGSNFSQEIPNLTITGKIRGDQLPENWDKLEILAWRDHGGLFDIDSVDFTWGQVKMNLQGALTLDRFGRPIGALQAQIANYAILVDGFRDIGTFTPDTANQLKGVLDQIVSINGGPDHQLRTGFTIDDGQLFIGPALLADKVPALFDDLPPAPVATVQP